MTDQQVDPADLTATTAADLAGRAWADRHRPLYHFVAPAGWLNDPNGLTHWRGTYHLFYQYNPIGPFHDKICWGHASSPDLVHWTDEPIALEPDTPPDADGCWSGVLVDDGGVPTLIYSGHRRDLGQMPCLAVGSPDLQRWTKDPGNPIIPERPPGLLITDYRDHCVWREGGRWRQLIGAGLAELGGIALLYESEDLRSWHYLGPLLSRADLIEGGLWTGAVWECVDLLRGTSTLPASDTLIFSVWAEDVTHYPVYVHGRYADGRLTVDTQPRHLDLGLNYFYAPQSLLDADGRRIMFGWAQEGRPESEILDLGWAGVLSLPRLIWRDDEGVLRQAPVPEVASLRVGAGCPRGVSVEPGTTLWLDDVATTLLDVEIELSWEAGSEAGIVLCATRDGAEETVLSVERVSESELRVQLDRSRASRTRRYDDRALGGPVPSYRPDGCRVRLLVDRSMIEIFVDDTPLSTRIYPSREDAVGLGLRAHATSPVRGMITWWPVAPVWDGPRTLRP